MPARPRDRHAGHVRPAGRRLPGRGRPDQRAPATTCRSGGFPCPFAAATFAWTPGAAGSYRAHRGGPRAEDGLTASQRSRLRVASTARRRARRPARGPRAGRPLMARPLSPDPTGRTAWRQAGRRRRLPARSAGWSSTRSARSSRCQLAALGLGSGVLGGVVHAGLGRGRRRGGLLRRPGAGGGRRSSACCPEFIIEVHFAFIQQAELVTANLTGATRLLLTCAVALPLLVALPRVVVPSRRRRADPARRTPPPRARDPAGLRRLRRPGRRPREPDRLRRRRAARRCTSSTRAACRARRTRSPPSWGWRPGCCRCPPRVPTTGRRGAAPRCGRLSSC